MKATLKFNLDDPDDRMAHMRCVMATNMALALWHLKHRCELEAIKEVVAETLDEYEINLESIIE